MKKLKGCSTVVETFPFNDRGETGADELFESFVDDDVSWGERCCTTYLGRLLRQKCGSRETIFWVRWTDLLRKGLEKQGYFALTSV